MRNAAALCRRGFLSANTFWFTGPQTSEQRMLPAICSIPGLVLTIEDSSAAD
jgi:hypothetical protein